MIAIKFYTDKTLITDKNRKRIFPLFLDIFFLNNTELSSYFVFEEDIKKADLAIFPIDITYLYKKRKEKTVHEFIETCRKNNLKTWLYSGGDIGKTINKKNVIVFRLGGFNSKMNTDTQIIPSFVQDPYATILNRPFTVLQKNEKPQIGFVGHANGSIKGILHEFTVFLYLLKEIFLKNFYFDFQPFFPSGYYRYKILQTILKNNKVDSNFIFRANYTGGTQQQGAIKESTYQFYENIEQNPYVFCMRGLGNFSVRFYETLIMGRIPVVPRSNMRLPLHQIINWEKHCVFVNSNSFAEDLLTFHNSISNEDFEKMQNNNRNLALNQLTRIGYFKEHYKQFFA